MNKPQDYSNHRAVPPASYLLAGLVLAVFTGRSLYRAIESPGYDAWLLVLVGAALFVTWNAARSRAMVVQDRVIRLEMQLRLERLLGPARRADVERIGLKQLIALRFASDSELPGLFEEVLAGRLADPKAIKQRVRGWQGDWLRV